ncbi:MAG TPA: hypothetical protein QF776_01040 [Acidimicrobiales bacterium]|jgi:hypothetical protein|nr:hypothetical protein [Acidimicrobiales bacterium]
MPYITVVDSSPLDEIQIVYSSSKPSGNTLAFSLTLSFAGSVVMRG